MAGSKHEAAGGSKTGCYPDPTRRDLLDHLATRRTIPAPNLGLPAPDRAEIQCLLTLAARVPDHGKLAPWRFIVYGREERVVIGRYLRQLWLQQEPTAGEDRLILEEERFLRAPLVIGVISRPFQEHKVPVWEQELSAGAVCLNLLHAASALGFSGQWLTEWYSYHSQSAQFLGAREGERFAGFIHLGTPTIPPTERPRPDLADIMTTWSPPAE